MEKIISGLLFVFFVLFPFGQLTRLPFGFLALPEVSLYLTDIVLFLFVFLWGVWRFAKVKRKYLLPPLAKPILLFSLLAGLSLIVNTPLLSSREVLVSGLYLVRWLVYAGLYFAIFDLKENFKHLKWPKMANYLVIIGTATAIFGLIQYFLWPDIRFLEDFGWDPHYFRVVGTFLDPGFTGMMLVLTLILLVVMNWEKIMIPEFKHFAIYCLLLIVYCSLTLTYSRSSYLAFMVGMAIIASFKKAPIFLVSVLAIGGLTLLILPRQFIGEGTKLTRTSTVVARQRNWQQSLKIARDHPILGVGFNAYRYVQKDYGFLGEKWQVTHAGAGADSSLLLVLTTTGIVGLMAYLWIWFRLVIKATTLRQEVILASALALLAHSFFLNSLFYPSLMAWTWLLFAYGE